MTGFSRTPVHQAVNRLADDTLILVRPRHGLQIAPIDLARERMLLQFRRDLERFVVWPAANRASRIAISCFIVRVLRDRVGEDIGEFNGLDRRIDQLLNWRPTSLFWNIRCGRCTRSSAASAGFFTLGPPRMRG